MTGRSAADAASGLRPCGAEPQDASQAKPLVPNALEDLTAIPASFVGSVNASIAISLKRIADMMEEDRKPRLELMPEGYIGEQEHRQLIKETLLRDVVAWEAIADAASYIAGRMPLPASAIEARSDAAPQSDAAEGESAVAKPDAPTPTVSQ